MARTLLTRMEIQEITENQISRLFLHQRAGRSKEQERQEKEADKARGILEMLSQRELEARKKYAARKRQQVEVEYDW